MPVKHTCVQKKKKTRIYLHVCCKVRSVPIRDCNHMEEASSVSRKCTATKECKKMGLIKCDGCSLRFCSDHFAIHRRELEARLELLCGERDAFHHELSEMCRDPIESLTQINAWEQETLVYVRKTADQARRHVPDDVALEREPIDVGDRILFHGALSTQIDHI